jgi:signal transduction histidine kinase
MLRIRTFQGLQGKILIAILAVGTVAVLTGLLIIYWIGQSHLQRTIGNQFQQMATETSNKLLLLINHHIKEAQDLAAVPHIHQGVREANLAYHTRGRSEQDILDRLRNLETLWEEASIVNPLVGGFLTNSASLYLKQYMGVPENRAMHLTVQVTDERGVLVAADSKPKKIYYGNEVWWQAAYHHGKGMVYLSDIEKVHDTADEFEQNFSLTLAVPVLDPTTHRAIGVLRTGLQVKPFFEAVTTVQIGRTDHTMLASSDGTLLFCPIFLIKNHTLRPELTTMIFKPQPGWAATLHDVHYGGKPSINGFAPVDFGPGLHPSSIGQKRWYIFTSQHPSETYEAIHSLAWWVAVAGMFSVVLLSFLGPVFARRLVRPIEQLRQGAKLIGFGNLDHRVRIETGDEIQELASEFNEMAIKLSASYSRLEQKVTDRTRELAVILKINQAISSNLNLHQVFDTLANEVGGLLSYDRISITLLDETGQQLHLRLIKSHGQPIVTKETPRPKEGTVVGWVLSHGKPFIRQDALITQEFFEDRLIVPEGLRSYIVVPIVSSQQVIGTLNLAAARPGAYTERNLDLLVPIADQLAIAVENARLFTETKRLEQMKSEFVSKVSHELRTPLTSIRGFTEILLTHNDVDSPSQREFLGIISEESERLTRLINDILDLSKIEAGKVDWRIEPISITEIVTHTVKSLRTQSLEKNIPILTAFPPAIPLVRGDRDHLIQVLDNLLSNAIKFTHQGKISIGVKPEGPMVTVWVQDTGIGIAPEEHERIFEKFHQLDDTRGGRPRGTGLGLAICREIVTYLGGRIWCESRPGQGSTFYFTLPVWSAAADAGAPASPLQAAAKPPKNG